MGDKNIKNEKKKKKRSDAKTVSAVSQKPVAPQPELIKKKKNPL